MTANTQGMQHFCMDVDYKWGLQIIMYNVCLHDNICKHGIDANLNCQVIHVAHIIYTDFFKTFNNFGISMLLTI